MLLTRGARGRALPLRRAAASAQRWASSWSPQVLGGEAQGPWEVELAEGGCGGRGVIQLAGPDAPKLLQGLITNDVAHHLPGPGHALAAAFLTNKGRIISDAIVTAAAGAETSPNGGGPDKLLVDVPLEHKDAILRHLRLFKLRAKVVITDLTAKARVRVLLNAGEAAAEAAYGKAGALGLAADPRIAPLSPDSPPPLGYRAIVPAETPPGACSPEAVTVAVPPAAYEALRLLHGVAEGHDLVERLPSESNVDLTHGVNFAKGCYLGQELTARTQFKGVVRKRLLPFFVRGAPPDSAAAAATEPAPVLSIRDLLPRPNASPLLAPQLQVLPSSSSESSSMPAKGSEVVDQATGKAVGTVITVSPRVNLGLALLRLESVLGAPSVSLVATAGKAGEDGEEGGGAAEATAVSTAPTHRLMAFTPAWWPALDLKTGKPPAS